MMFKWLDFYLLGVIAAFIMTNGIIGVTTNTRVQKERYVSTCEHVEEMVRQIDREKG